MVLRDRRTWRGEKGDAPSASSDPTVSDTSSDVQAPLASGELTPLNSLGLEAISETGDAFYEWVLGEDRLVWAENAGSILGIASADDIATGRAFASRLVSRKGTSRYEAIVSSGLRDNGKGVSYQIEYIIQDDDGEEHWVEDRGRWFGDAEGRPYRAVGLVRVVTHRRRREDELTYLATYDELTGHLNRQQLKDTLNDKIADVRRSGLQGAYLVVAIDNLAIINESYGFDVADKVIVEVGKRLLRELRTTDVIGRSSGNKFGIILSNCNEAQMCSSAERLLSAVCDMVIEIDTGPIATTVSIGCVSVPSNADTAQGAMMRAEEALTEAKYSRRASYVAFHQSPEKDQRRRSNLKLADELVAALNERRLTLAFQPLVAAQTLEPVLHEALLRLKQKDGAIVAAGRFIPIAEKLGLIRLIDHRVLEMAFEELLHEKKPQIAINVSGYTITDKVWLDMFVALSRAHPSATERLVVEITETVAVEEISESQAFVATVSGQGAKIAIDDFGAGYTSFRNLKRLAVDMVKIDGTFVEGLMGKPDNRMFLRTFVDLARNFGLPTVAECVSCEEEVAFLREIGVEYFQGFHLGVPVLTPPWRDGEQQESEDDTRSGVQSDRGAA